MTVLRLVRLKELSYIMAFGEVEEAFGGPVGCFCGVGMPPRLPWRERREASVRALAGAWPLVWPLLVFANLTSRHLPYPITTCSQHQEFAMEEGDSTGHFLLDCTIFRLVPLQLNSIS